MKRVKYVQIANAELKVNCYTGETCDQHAPEWHGYFDGDKEGGKIGDTITLPVGNFRPGTKIVITEPVCPECHFPRELCEQTKHCDFDWKAWDEEQYA